MIDSEDVFEEENDGADGADRRELEELYDQSLKNFKAGTVVSGRVVQVRSGSVMMDLGYKSDGIIPADHFTPAELAQMKPGDEFEVYLEAAEDANGNLVLSREKAKRMHARESLNHAYETGTPVKGTVLSKIKGG
ncbi:MAG TPA: 30S ribosomal protein S1, partial [Nitrospiraceae bacterium]|nr:30S ribosomal protein S1 [Nitrospiraceae bacterium]